MEKADEYEYVDKREDGGFEVLFMPYENQIERDRWEMAVLLPTGETSLSG